ncbi:MAG: tetraacyldisaccharide 4'-kinase [Flavobacteriales bacterium]|jgi:tetraacyldisaccharide 4'-kinase|nr:tetraacyldisaccharide 4'-kinase [Flavobacteriales bacterium]
MNQWRKILLYPFGALYHAITAGRNFLYDTQIKKSTKFDLPIICIGNIAVGGTGKTPLTEYIIRLLQKDYQVATLSRGYGRTTKIYTEATIESSSNEVGDEPAQYKRKFPNIPVVVENKRVAGVQQLMVNHPQTEVVLLDDAFQHRAIEAGFNIVVTDYNNPLASDYLLPAGNLRESKTGIKRADAIIVSKCPANLSDTAQQQIKKRLRFHAPQNIYFTTIQYGKTYHVFDGTPLPFSPKESTVLLVTGIGKPKPLQDYVKAQFRAVKVLSYGDHHEFSSEDIDTILTQFNKIAAPNKLILTTEKDASRLLKIKRLKTLPLFCIEIEVDFLNKKDKFNAQIEEYVRTNKANR